MTATASAAAVKTAITPTRAENYAEWFQQVNRAADMAEMSGVRGCMVIKPWGYGIWERLQQELDSRFKATGHQNCYFPLFIPLSYIQKEAEHVSGFAKEMAVVTHHRLVMKDGRLVPDGELEEPLIVRPTSETVIGEAFAKWVQSYRDLPLLVNQWANVVRWEMRPRIWLRTAEFLWQEGHTAHTDEADARAEVMRMLEVYREVVEATMALPVIPGEKIASERFPGAVSTYCIEAMMQDGRALQAGTSHYLGQNFAKAANIRFQNEGGVMEFAHTTSWGVSTRLIGALIMAHSDDDGLRCPPAMAPQQVAIVPIMRDAGERERVLPYAEQLATALRQQQWQGQPVRVQIDRRDLPSADKRWEWIKKGTPLILEVGPRDLDQQQVALTRRPRLTEKKAFVPFAQLVSNIATELQAVHDQLFTEAKTYQEARTRRDVTTLAAFTDFFQKSEANGFSQGQGFVHAGWCGDPATLSLLEPLGVTIRCIPFAQPTDAGNCVLTGRPATQQVIFARAY